MNSPDGTHDAPEVSLPALNSSAAPSLHVIPTEKAAEAWGIDFSLPKTRRKTTAKERRAIVESRLRRLANDASASPNDANMQQLSGQTGVDSEGNKTVALSQLPVVNVDGLQSRESLVPINLSTTRQDLEARLILRVPRLLCVTKQYPRSCGMSSLASVYNYLYSRIGESEQGAGRPPVSQEELMTILGFEPPFDQISWGPFTGNATLLRWFHALNRHFGHKGRAYILYKVHGSGNTSHLYKDDAAALEAVKAALRDPHCALVYHCYNHYMVPVGFQEIPEAQTDFLKPVVPASDCDTTVFIAEVSRGRHEAMYARKWSEIVKDLSCCSPEFYNIRHPEMGIQTRAAKGAKQAKQSMYPQSRQNAEANEVMNAAPAGDLAENPTPAQAPVDDPVPTGGGDVLQTEPRDAAPALPQRERGNLHCLICFRNDEAEEHPEKFELMSDHRSRSSSASERSSTQDDREE